MPVIDGTSSSEELKGTGGDDRISGFSGNDTLLGGKGDDTLIGGFGDDSLTGGPGNDVFRYDAREFGDDVITDFRNGDRIDLSAFNVADLATLMPYMSDTPDGVLIDLQFGGDSETILIEGVSLDDLSATDFIFRTGNAGLTVNGENTWNDVLFGGKGADRLNGFSGDDGLNGGGGNDTLIGGFGDDVLRGGAGSDVFRYDAREFGDDVIKDFSRTDKIDLSAFNVADLATLRPYMTETPDGVLIDLQFGGDSETIFIEGATLADIATRNFVFNAAATNLTVNGQNTWNDVLFGGDGADRLNGFSGDDELNGGAGIDTLIGGFGDDLLRGGAGADVFRYDAREFGDDVIADFGSTDRIDLSAFNVADLATLRPYMTETPDGVLIDLQFGGDSETILIQNATFADLATRNFVFNASAADKVVNGQNTWNDVLFGGNGDDRVSGLSGDDGLNGGAGNDTLIGGFGDDVLRGGAGADVFRYDAREFGDDVIKDFGGADKIDLSAFNVADFATLKPYLTDTPDGVLIDLQFGGDSETILIEGVSLDDLSGSDFIFRTGTTGLTVNGENTWNDVLFGGNGADRLSGFSGNDELNGGAGNDTLIGGFGDDMLRGGAGSDVILFNTLSTSDADTVVDFARGTDEFQLDDAVFTGLTDGPLAGGAFRNGTAALDSSDRIIYNKSSGVLLYDADGLGGAAAIHIATLTNNAALSASDFEVV